MGTVSGRTYTNKTFGIEVTFPDTWLIPDSDFEAYMKKNGFDVSLKAYDLLPAYSKSRIDQAMKNLTVLLTAYRSMPGTPDNSIVRISVLDLKATPQVNDAVSYLNAVRVACNLKDVTCSENKIEKFGSTDFGVLDADSALAGKRRLYVMVRNGFATIFTLSYSDPEDLGTFRQLIENGNFALKK